MAGCPAFSGHWSLNIRSVNVWDPEQVTLSESSFSNVKLEGDLKRVTLQVFAWLPLCFDLCVERVDFKVNMEKASVRRLIARHWTHTRETLYMQWMWERFTLKNSLSTHQQTHREEKLYMCSQCGKGFSTKHCLIIHQQTHTGEKPYVCSVCGKGFTMKGDLVHQCTHTTEKPFTCSNCILQPQENNPGGREEYQ